MLLKILRMLRKENCKGGFIMNIEKEFSEIDFSKNSKIKESLLDKLMQERMKGISRVELDLEEMDYVAAAGNALFGKRNL